MHTSAGGGPQRLGDTLALSARILCDLDPPQDLLTGYAGPDRQAIEQIEVWLESPSLVLMTETATDWHALRALLERGRIIGAQGHDARIAALCIQHRVCELWAIDRDFTRFPQLSVKNPFAMA